MKIIISGLTAAGKTTHSKLLARDFKLDYVHGSKILGEMMNPSTKKRSADYWITDESFQEDELRISNPDKDFLLDDYLKQTLEGPQNNLIFDVWTLPWLSSHNALRIWLESSLKSRAIKSMISIMESSSFTYEDVAKRIPIRDQNTRNFYFKYYNFDIFVDRHPFDFVIDISNFVSDIHTDPNENIQKVHETLVALVNWYENPKVLPLTLVNMFDLYSDSMFLKIPEDLGVMLKGRN